MREAALRDVSESAPAQAEDDARLVAAVLRRDRKAAAEMVQRFSDPLYAYLRRRLVPQADLADDLLQEVFLAAIEQLGELREPGALRGWLFGIARHKVESHYRRRLLDPLPLDDQHTGADMGEEPLFEESIDQRRAAERTWEIVAALPKIYATVLLWRYWEKRSAQEMADATGRTPKAIERLLARARTEFKRRWRDE